MLQQPQGDRDNLLCSFRAELTTLDVQHEITTTDILHDEVYSCLRLETCVEIQEEGVSLLVGNQENSLLRPSTLNFIVFDDKLLLQNLDGVKLLCCLGLCQHDLTKVTLTQNSQEVKMIEANATTSPRFVGSWSWFTHSSRG